MSKPEKCPSQSNPPTGEREGPKLPGSAPVLGPCQRRSFGSRRRVFLSCQRRRSPSTTFQSGNPSSSPSNTKAIKTHRKKTSHQSLLHRSPSLKNRSQRKLRPRSSNSNSSSSYSHRTSKNRRIRPLLSPRTFSQQSRFPNPEVLSSQTTP